MPNGHLYAEGFRALLKELGERRAAAVKKVEEFQRSIEEHDTLPANAQLRVGNRLRELADRRMLPLREVKRAKRQDIEDLLADPHAAAQLLVPEATRECLQPVILPLCQLLVGAFDDGCIRQPALWRVLRLATVGRGQTTPPAGELYERVVACLRQENQDAFAGVGEGSWQGVRDCQAVLGLLADAVRADEDPAARTSKETRSGRAAPSPTGEQRVLGPRQLKILKAMLQLGALSEDSRRTTDEIAREAEGPDANPESFKAPMSSLSERGYVCTAAHRGGGCWLTAVGRRRAQIALGQKHA